MFWSENAGEISICPEEENQFYWEVPNYFAYQPTNAYRFETSVPSIVSSPWFSAFNRKWRLALILSGEINVSDTVGFFLWVKASSKEVPCINAELIAMDSDGNEYKKCNGDVDINGRFGSWNFFYLGRLMKEKHKISPAGVLTLLCIMEKKVPIIFGISGGSNDSDNAIAVRNDDSGNVNEPKEMESEPKGVDRLVQNMKSLLLDELSSDVVLKVEDQEFKAHKNILKVRSPVFSAMFQPHTKENATGVVDITDCSAAVFDVFLLYVYTGGAEVISLDNACELFYAADKYEMNDLKSECIEFMENNLSVENFFDIIKLCFRHSESDLLKTATLFFCENVKRIIKTIHWQKFMKNYTTQANELIIKAFGA